MTTQPRFWYDDVIFGLIIRITLVLVIVSILAFGNAAVSIWKAPASRGSLTVQPPSNTVGRGAMLSWTSGDLRCYQDPRVPDRSWVSINDDTFGAKTVGLNRSCKNSDPSTQGGGRVLCSLGDLLLSQSRPWGLQEFYGRFLVHRYCS